jgi:hypothetical protein
VPQSPIFWSIISHTIDGGYSVVFMAQEYVRILFIFRSIDAGYLGSFYGWKIRTGECVAFVQLVNLNRLFLTYI